MSALHPIFAQIVEAHLGVTKTVTSATDTDAHPTPGPWAYIDASTRADMQFKPTCVIRGNGKQIASFSWQSPSVSFPSREESRANAHLIAGAPTLLAALRLVVTDYPLGTPKRRLIEAAIAEATGAA